MVVHTKEELGPTSAEKNMDVYAELDAIERSSFLLNSIADKQEIVSRRCYNQSENKKHIMLELDDMRRLGWTLKCGRFSIF